MRINNLLHKYTLSCFCQIYFIERSRCHTRNSHHSYLTCRQCNTLRENLVSWHLYVKVVLYFQLMKANIVRAVCKNFPTGDIFAYGRGNVIMHGLTKYGRTSFQRKHSSTGLQAVMTWTRPH